MRKSLLPRFILLSTIYYLLSTGLCGCQDKALYKDTQVLMGTFVEVISPDENAKDIVFAEIKRIEDLLSKYKPDSEISKLNKLGQLKVSPDTLFIIKKAKSFWQLSDGAFDITVGPLLDLWGFTDKKFYLPSKLEIEGILKFVGSDKLLLQEDDNMVKFKISGMKIDLGAIAKGYAVDCAVKKIKEKGIKSCLINAGGQIFCLGDKFGKPWHIAVQNPRDKNDILTYLDLKDKAVATSGDYEQYFFKDNHRYCHIFNPKTGYPVETDFISVTVVAADGLTADALATAIFVLGKEKGEVLAKKFPDVKVKIIEERDVSYNK